MQFNLNTCPFILHILLEAISFYLCSRIEWSGAYCFWPVCLSVCLSVCLLSTLTFAITFELKRGGDFIFSMHFPLMKPFQMTPRSMTSWPWLWPWSQNSLLDFVANRGIVFYKHTLISSAPEPKAQVHYCDHALSVVHRPSVRLSIRRELFTFSTSPLKPLNGIQQNLTESKISMPSTKIVFFWPIGKTKWPPWPLIG